MEIYFGLPNSQPIGKQSFHLRLNFKNNIQIKHSQKAYPQESLFAELGGYLGIFVGSSLLDVYGLIGKVLKFIYRFKNQNERATP